MQLTDALDLVPPFVWQVAAGIIAAAVLLAGLHHASRYVRCHSLEDVLTVIAASIATGVSAQGMWQFIDRTLHLHPALQLGMFAFIEVAVITSAVRAKRSMTERFSAGIDGIAVWALTSLSAALSAMEARSLPEAVFRLAAPLVAAWLWERGMAVERRRVSGLSGINWRLTPERILVRLGLAEARDRTADEVDAHRRLTRVARAAKKVYQLRQAGASDRRIRAAVTRRDRAIDLAVAHTSLARDKTKQAALLDLLTAFGGGDSLSAVLETASAPWADLDHPAVTATRQVALEGGATREVADTATDTTPAPTPVAVTPAEPAATNTGSGSATTATDTIPVAPPAPARHRHPAPAATGSATATDTDTSGGTATATDTDTRAATTPEPATPDTDTDTGDDTLTITANAKATMRRYWDHAITREGYLPDGAELARAGRCRDSYGRRMRAEWSEELDPQLCARLKEEAKRRKQRGRLQPRKVIAPPALTTPEPLIAHVNGHHTDGAA